MAIFEHESSMYYLSVSQNKSKLFTQDRVLYILQSMAT